MNFPDAKKAAWVFLLDKGYVASNQWSYYGSLYEPLAPDKSYEGDSWDYTEYLKEILKKEISEYGIDWNKTTKPTSEKKYCFNGTDNDSSPAEILSGTLFLNNGKSYFIATRDIGFSSYISEIVETLDSIMKSEFFKIMEK